ncbi:ABC transporter substrate-binding protein [Micromonospora endolithica]|uniref:Sugar ABC transporter substrate-binding protein n=1 Tax=Micromonospora endolithica TaxID=230091 RepID=A0A3A9ZMH5_9ACTN|nr:sugar ABC transporter substrate-binding protein [Micromonospora endolithica]RKN48556.1 sugar ABC transporter substrate-binding protein [Micromonospora endolithica]TWJ22121.1 carbohydrate ABC transporter substrate-binding protein (CUT1 family) [Micromonospora endolithica]
MTLTRTVGLPRRGFLGLTAGAGAAALLGTAACGAGGTSTGGSGDAKTLTVACEGGGKIELQPIVDKFQQATGATVTLVELPYEGLFNRLTSELSNGKPSFDVCAVDAVWLPLFAGKLAGLDDLFTPEVKGDLFPALVQEAQSGGSFVGMPVWTNSEILFYRKDLFEDPKEKAAFQTKYGYPLAPPTTWQQFTDIAVFFTRPDQKLWGTDVKGAVETEWLAHVLQAGSPGVVLDDGGSVIVDNAQHLAALAFYADLNNKHKVAPAGAAQTDWNAAQNLFNQGQTAMTRFWAHAYRQIPADAKVAGKVGAAPMIGGTAGVAGIPGPWYLSAPKDGAKNDLAKQFIKAAYDDNALSIETTLGLAARKSAYQSFADKPGFESFGPLLTTLNASATRPRPASPHWQRIVDSVLVPTIQKALTPGADYAALLKAARTQIEGIIK